MSDHDHLPTVVSTSTAEPDPRVLQALGGHHTITSALADLVDNSLDAGATHVLIRFLTSGDHATGLVVVDDGRGMSAEQLDNAMVYGGRREYGATDLGHYGVGMKAASLSQAEEMHVFTRRDGYTAAGRGLSSGSLSSEHGPVISHFDSHDVETRLSEIRADFVLTSGTVIRWLRPKAFSRSADPREARSWLTTIQNEIRTELGLTFHRALDSGAVTILLDEFDTELGEAGIAAELEPLDPFACEHWSTPGFAEDLTSSVNGHAFTVRAVTWPSQRADTAEFYLGTRDGQARQGFYVYRNDRLLQAGGWNGLMESTRDRMFARVAVDLTPELEAHVRMNSEKQGIVFSQAFADALPNARGAYSGDTFTTFMAVATGTAESSRKRERRRELLVKPANGGIVTPVQDAMETNFGFDPNQPEVDIQWDLLDPDTVFNFDVDGRKLLLNLRHRKALTGREGPVSPANSPMITTLLYLFARNEFKRITEGNVWLDTQKRWQEVLLAAVRAQESADGHKP
ncbi:ATP-binding protein [Kocuria sp. ZOR0020]|uniref:ATP-binding protein n=1 Tax=Kocuria sp. ZOR0020 TaxID=1339234 RepID=UPI000647EA50|nr:ATP-binding protein [Kocuria sp. ZOR0020]